VESGDILNVEMYKRFSAEPNLKGARSQRTIPLRLIPKRESSPARSPRHDLKICLSSLQSATRLCKDAEYAIYSKPNSVTDAVFNKADVSGLLSPSVASQAEGNLQYSCFAS
jgi:hypothetical protein